MELCGVWLASSHMTPSDPPPLRIYIPGDPAQMGLAWQPASDRIDPSKVMEAMPMID